MDVIHPRTDVIRIMEVLEGAQKLHIGPRRFYGADVGIHGGYGLVDVVELGIAHMRVYLGRVLNASSSEARRVGKEGVSTCRSGWSATHEDKKRRKNSKRRESERR